MILMICSVVSPLSRPYKNVGFPLMNRYKVLAVPRTPRLSATADKQALRRFHRGHMSH